MIFRPNPNSLYIHMYESKNTKILSSILIITLSYIVFIVSKMFPTICGVKNFSEGVKNFQTRPLFLPKSTISCLSIDIPEKQIFIITLISLVFYPNLQKFFTPHILSPKSFSISHIIDKTQTHNKLNVNSMCNGL